MTSPCSWPIDRSGFPELPPVGDPGYQAALDRQLGMEDLAVEVLWALTGRQFGVCQVTERPMPIEHQPGEVGGGLRRLWPYRPNLSRTIINDWSGLFGRQTGSRLNGPSMVSLPGPAWPHSDATPTVVTIGHCGDEGPEILDPSEYVIQNNILYRKGGKVWPFQDLGRPLGECCTWSISYYRGVRPPRGVAAMTGCLALEFIRAGCGDGKCRLPKSVTKLSRNGVSYDIDPMAIYAAGKTGIPEIDSWLSAVNPNHMQQAPSVL